MGASSRRAPTCGAASLPFSRSFSPTAGLAVSAHAPAVRAEEHVELIPDEKAGWSPANIFSFAKGGYYSDRTLRVETSPPGAKLDLFYVRASFQKRYEQAVAPVIIDLPKRSDAGKRDSVTIRAALAGYQAETVHVPVRGDQNEIVIDLKPLGNTLAAVTHTYFAGREGLTFITKVPAQVRLQKGADGFTVVLGQTAGEGRVEASLDGLRSPLVESVVSNQLGEDLMLQVKLTRRARIRRISSMRARESQDAVRGLYRYTIDLGGSGNVDRARGALGSLGSGDVSGCSAAFDADAAPQPRPRAAVARAVAARRLHGSLRARGAASARRGVARWHDPHGGRVVVPPRRADRTRRGGDAGCVGQGVPFASACLGSRARARAVSLEALRSLVAPEMDRAAFVNALGAANAAGCGTATAGAEAGPG